MVRKRTFNRLIVVFVFLVVLQATWAQDKVALKLTPEFHRERREAARRLMPDSSVMIVFSAPAQGSLGVPKYQPSPNLYYFTGFEEEIGVLLIFKTPQRIGDETFKEIFFVREANEPGVRFNGPYLGAEGVKEQLGFADAYNTSQLQVFDLNLNRFKTLLMSPLPLNVPRTGGVGYLYQRMFTQAKSRASASRIDEKMFNHIVGNLRLIKTPEELELLKAAVEISCRGQNEVMRSVHSEMSELEIEGIHQYVHKRYGAESMGYGAIIASGENGCIRHYMNNKRERVGDDLVLMDVGAEYHRYTADVTRTIPANGKFSTEQRAIYQIVYDAQEACFSKLRAGGSVKEIYKAGDSVMRLGLKRLGLDKAVGKNGIYMSTGFHSIGLVVHDPFQRRDTLRKNMVLAIEPGIYIPVGSNCDKKWWGIAVMIEDDVLITDNGYELLSRSAPRSIEEIEKLIAEPSPLDNFKLPRLESIRRKDF